MKNKRRLKILALTFLATFTSATLVTSTIAWFKYGTNITFGDGGRVPIDAGAEAAYFAYGQGSSSNPFGIANRVHLYNLAWLQYIGYFDGSKTDRPLQPYFELANSVPSTGLDMDGIVLPPIGTDAHPFIGAFNGNNKTIVNLTVSNDDPTQVSSDFGVMKPSATDLTGTTNPEIIGFFGVVGALPNQSIANYSSSVVSVKNLTLKNLTVKSKTTKTLIGLAAGYVDGAMSGVKISGDATLDLSSSGKQKVTSVAAANNLSDYALVGYSKQTGSSGDYCQKLSKYYASDDPNHGGDSWGGSMPFRAFNMFVYNHFLAAKNSYGLRASTISTTTTTLNSYTSPTNDYKINMYYSCYTSGSVVTKLNSSGDAYQYYMAPDAFNSIGTSSGKSALMYKLSNGSYIPLQFSEDEDEWEHTKTNNVGYIAGKDNSVIMASVYQKKMGNSTGDTAVSYSTAGGIYDALYTESTPLEIVTYSSSGSTAGWCLIKDDKNSSHTVANPRITEYKNKKYTASTLGYDGYATARSNFESNLLKDKRLNGIQFVNSTADGSLPTMLTISSGLKIDGKTNSDYTNYQVPQGYANFKVKEKGRISLFAGTYNAGSQPTTMTFFSLYKVDRNSTTGAITGMTRISEVYTNTASGATDPYVYKYSNGNYSTGSHGSTPVMNLTSSLESDLPMNSGTNNSKNNLIYYFEIPVNAGEYAIGMVPGKASGVSGANLVYLDIGTNGADAEAKRIMGYTITTEISGLKYPVGVDFEVVGTNTITTGGVSFCLQIAPAASGNSTKFTITSTNVTISTQNIASSFSYKGSNYSDQSSPPSGKFKVTNGPNTTISPYTEKTRVSHISVPSSGGRTEITVTDVFNGANISSTTYRYNNTDYPSNDTSGTPSIPNAISTPAPLLTSSVVTTVRALDTAITLTRDNSGLIATFNAVLPTMPWTNGNLYDATISSYPSGLKINASRTSTSYSLKINTANVTFDASNNGVYPTT